MKFINEIQLMSDRNEIKNWLAIFLNYISENTILYCIKFNAGKLESRQHPDENNSQINSELMMIREVGKFDVNAAD